eukprot:176797-Amphidinium_carterae.1
MMLQRITLDSGTDTMSIAVYIRGNVHLQRMIRVEAYLAQLAECTTASHAIWDFIGNWAMAVSMPMHHLQNALEPNSLLD